MQYINADEDPVSETFNTLTYTYWGKFIQYGTDTYTIKRLVPEQICPYCLQHSVYDIAPLINYCSGCDIVYKWEIKYKNGGLA